ncbi:MAG: histidine phosphatase family protein [Mycobacterium leprae]
MTIFTLVRHGTPLYGMAEERRLKGGVRDWVPLSPQGIAEIEQTAERLRGTSATLILASPMTRALHTAAILGRALDLPLAVEFDLHEWLPDTTQSYDSAAVAFAATSDLEAHGGEWPPGESRPWEPLSSVRQRVLGVLQRYTHLEHVIVACHGMVITALTGEALPCGGSTTYTC